MDREIQDTLGGFMFWLNLVFINVFVVAFAAIFTSDYRHGWMVLVALGAATFSLSWWWLRRPSTPRVAQPYRAKNWKRGYWFHVAWASLLLLGMTIGDFHLWKLCILPVLGLAVWGGYKMREFMAQRMAAIYSTAPINPTAQAPADTTAKTPE